MDVVMSCTALAPEDSFLQAGSFPSSCACFSGPKHILGGVFFQPKALLSLREGLQGERITGSSGRVYLEVLEIRRVAANKQERL